MGNNKHSLSNLDEDFMITVELLLAAVLARSINKNRHSH